jgi:argininosuccinate lyase
VKRAEDLQVPLERMPLPEMRKIESAINKDVLSVLSVDASVNSRTSFGGTAPQRVLEQIAFWREKLK